MMTMCGDCGGRLHKQISVQEIMRPPKLVCRRSPCASAKLSLAFSLLFGTPSAAALLQFSEKMGATTVFDFFIEGQEACLNVTW